MLFLAFDLSGPQSAIFAIVAMTALALYDAVAKELRSRRVIGEQIANAISYVRSEWGNTAPEVQPETVAKVRADTAGRKTYWTAAELQKIGQ